MNKHQKLALYIAPFLVVMGFIATDYYAEYKQSEEILYELDLQGECVLGTGGCELQKDQFKLEFFNEQGQTQMTSSHPLTSAVLSRVMPDETEQTFQMTTDAQRTAWYANTGIDRTEDDNAPLLLRLIVSVDNTLFFKEFTASVLP